MKTGCNPITLNNQNKMNNRHHPAWADPKHKQPLKKRLRHILDTERLDTQRDLISAIATELETDILECAAALLYLTPPPNHNTVAVTEPKSPLLPAIRMVRYRLDLGSQHQLTLEQLTKVLVEESGVDKNNINNVAIRGLYTLIDLPDAMPPDIFQHLKSVEINQRKLDIRRVKVRKKRREPIHRRNKATINKPKFEQPNPDPASNN